MNESTKRRDTTTDLASELERVTTDFLGIGRAWAAHGLSIGRSALELCAKSLDVTARLLGDLAQRVTPHDAAPAAAAAEAKVSDDSKHGIG